MYRTPIDPDPASFSASAWFLFGFRTSDLRYAECTFCLSWLLLALMLFLKISRHRWFWANIWCGRESSEQNIFSCIFFAFLWDYVYNAGPQYLEYLKLTFNQTGTDAHGFLQILHYINSRLFSKKVGRNYPTHYFSKFAVWSTICRYQWVTRYYRRYNKNIRSAISLG